MSQNIRERVQFQNETELGLVSIVVVCYNDFNSLRTLFQSISKRSYEKIEVICVLNAGDPRSERLIQECGYQSITPESNLWYSGGNNLGVEAAAGEYVLILNPDTELEPNSVELLVSKMESNPDTGVVVPQVLDSEGRIDSVGMAFTIGGWYKNVRQGDQQLEVTNNSLRICAFDGPSFLIRREAIEDVGLFDRGFEFYQESVDLSIRLQRAGWNLVCVPSAIVYHEGGGSFEDDRSNVVVQYGIQNDLLLLGKNYSYLHLLFQFPLHLYRHISQLVSSAIQKDIDRMIACFKGILLGLLLFVRELPSTDRMSFKEQNNLFLRN